MSNQENVSPIYQSLVTFHKVITRGLEVSTEKGAEYIERGLPANEIWQGFLDYIFSLLEVLTSHHRGEDEVGFPAMQKAIPRAPYNQFASDHQLIEGFIMPSYQAIESLRAGDTGKLSELVENLNMISSLWPPHIRMEEVSFSTEAVNAVLSLDEQAQILADWSKFGQTIGKFPFLTIPFTVYNLSGKLREGFVAGLPPAIRDELIPKEWKPRWEPMAPFLLE